jgi:poly(3-hydroxybutyrate) depolymerase
MLHGTSQEGLDFYTDSKWREKADEVGLIVVFANALSYCYSEDENGDGDFVDPGERRVSTKWTHGPLGDPAQMPFCTAAEIATLSAQQRALIDHPFQDDVLYLDAVIAFLKTNNVIDEKRIYAAGFSNGASFASRLAVERSQTFAAIAAHAGPLQVPPVPGRTLSFMATLGAKDDKIAVTTGLAQLPVSPSLLTDVPAIKSKGITPMLTQLRLADANTYDVATVSGKRVATFAFRTSLAGASNEYTFSIIEDNFHQYPNGVNHPVVMANLLWPFFETKRLP